MGKSNNAVFLIAESVMLGSKEKLSKAFLPEPSALILSSFEIVFVKMYVMIYIKKKQTKSLIM